MNNQKKILIIGGKPIGSLDILKYAKSLGLYTIVCDYLPISESPAKQIADEVWDYSTANVDLIVERAKEENISAVFTGVHEFNIKQCQKICEKLKLPFYATKKDIEVSSNKKIYKEIFRKFDIPVIEEYKVSNIDNVNENIMYPILIKPVDASGARGLQICNSRDEVISKLEDALNFSNKKEIIAERYIQDKEEITVVYIIQNAKPYLASVADRIVKYFDNAVIPLPIEYKWVSKYLNLYKSEIDEKMKLAIKEMNLQNGMLFIQAIVKDNVIMPYDIGFRLSGTQEHIILEEMCGYNPLKLLVDYSLTKKFGDENLINKINPDFSCFVNQITFLVKPSKITRFEGLEDVEKMQGVIRIVKNKIESETIPESAWGTLNQVALRIYIKADTFEERELLIDKIKSAVKIYSNDELVGI